mmetsp:Transcript_2769/g.4077  ORF Transcript_2769/g.4077 Transcript_2769/m.4077 type:complete len:101 (-) Transcript_2769:482-784(-)
MLAFFFCIDLEEIQLNDGLKIIQELAFSQCTFLKRIHIPSSLITMGKKAFSGCASVTEVTLSSQQMLHHSRDRRSYCLVSSCQILLYWYVGELSVYFVDE